MKKFGDIDGDGGVTIMDLAKLKLHLIEKQLLDDKYFGVADLDKDGSITINDLAKLKLMIIMDEKK